MALIADAQIPHGRYIFHSIKAESPEQTFRNVLDKIIYYIVKSTVARVCMNAYIKGGWKPEDAEGK